MKIKHKAIINGCEYTAIINNDKVQIYNLIDEDYSEYFGEYELSGNKIYSKPLLPELDEEIIYIGELIIEEGK